MSGVKPTKVDSLNITADRKRGNAIPWGGLTGVG